MSKFDRFDAFSTSSATFNVVVDGKTLGSFMEASGLEVEVEVFEVEEGGQNFFIHKLPGRFKFPNLNLKRGLTADNGLIAWIDESSAGAFEKNGMKLKRTTVALVLTSAKGDPLRTWTFYDAFPVRWNGPSFTSGSDDYLVEELEIAHHGFSVKDENPQVNAAKAAAKKAAKKAAAKAAPKQAAPAKKAAKAAAKKGAGFAGQKKAAKKAGKKGAGFAGQKQPAKKAAPAKKPAKKAQPRYMDSTASSRAKQKPPAKKGGGR